ncbi:MAG: sodium-dependent transporter [Pacificimonas sp.]
MAAKTASQEQWSGKAAFILAAVGSAVGLGNLWRFPAEAGSNGGGAFVIFYILCVVLIGLPVLLSETLIGRHGQTSAPGSVRKVAAESGASPRWAVLAMLGAFGAFLIISFYSVLGGWVLFYIGQFLGDFAGSLGNFTGGAFEGTPAEEVQALLPALFADNVTLLGLHAVFMGITVFVVARGVSGGIEFVATRLMPAFFFLFLGITIYGAVEGDFGAAATFLFSFEPAKLTPPVMLAALGQAFFSLSLGSALMITYGAYAGRDVNLASTSGIIAAADTSVALIAGFAIFPIVFAAGLAVDAGPTLMFQTLPTSFMAMPAGSLIGLAFFVMVFFAALTSSVALLEAPTVWAMDKFDSARAPTALVVGGAAFGLGVVAALSFNILGDLKPLDAIPLFAGQGIFDILDTLTGKIMLPLAALLTAIFTGWVADKRLIDAENGISGGLHLIWRFLIAWLCPLALVAILVFGVFFS